MTIAKALCILIVLVFFPLTTVRAADGRDLIIQKQMDCVDEHTGQKGAITWDDVCDIPESYYQQHMQAVNQDMDQMQGPAPVHLQTPPKKPEWVYTLAPETSYIRYTEPGFMKEHGIMYGINGNLTYHAPEGSALNSEISDTYRFEGRFSYGKVSYHGGIQNSDGTVTPESFNGISDYMVEIRALIEKEFNLTRSIMLTPYMGAGYRSLFDALFANKPFGYNRHIQYGYIPTGTEITAQLGDGWSITADTEYDIFLGGVVDSYLKEIGLGNLHNIQRSGYGLRGSLKLTKKGDRYDLFLEPFVRYWSIHNSRPAVSTPFTFDGQEFVLAGQEPANNSLEMGGRLGVEF